MRGLKMTLRKFGTEAANVEVKPEDNDQQTLSNLKSEAALPDEILDAIDRAANDPSYGVRRARPTRHD